MIKKTAVIRKFTKKQLQQMELIQEQQKIKTVPKILFFALEQYHELQKDKARLERLIAYKQNKIEKLQDASN